MKLFKGKKEPATQVETPVTHCEHVTLIPRWDSVDDIGKEDAVTAYRCEACGQEFSANEAARLRETESARLQRKMAS